VLCFDVLRNGKHVARGGLKSGVLMAALTWVSRTGKAPPEELGHNAVVPGLDARLGGLDTTRPARQSHVDWFVLKDISLGDEFAIRVTRSSRADPPRRRELASSQQQKKRGVEVRRCFLCDRLRPEKRDNDKPNVALGANAAACRQCLVIAEALLESRTVSALNLSRVRKGTCSFCARPKPPVVVRGKRAGICAACVKGINTAF
jgi:hypothetical protein